MTTILHTGVVKQGKAIIFYQVFRREKKRKLQHLFVCLCFTSLQQRSHLETAPPFTVPCEGREARKIHRPNENRTPGRRVTVHCFYLLRKLRGPAKGGCDSACPFIKQLLCTPIISRFLKSKLHIISNIEIKLLACLTYY